MDTSKYWIQEFLAAMTLVGRPDADAEHYNYFRDYDATLGRYIESDPIALQGGLNTFAYTDGNPLIGYDTRGTETAMCTRRLNNVPIRVGPLFHQYICVPDGKGGKTCGGLGPSGSMRDSPGKVEYESSDSQSKSQCKKVADDDKCLEDCIQKKFREGPPNYSVDLSHGDNCQTWADRAFITCQAECRGKK